MGEQMSDYFFNCDAEFEDIPKAILNYIAENKNISWASRFGILLHDLDREFFRQFKKLDSLMTHFQCQRHPIFKFEPNVCYGWHFDNPTRSCALNMLLTGNSSYTFCGETTNKIDFHNVKRVLYNENKFTLLNVTKHHTVYNLENTRYLLTVSIPPSAGNFDDVKQYLIENNF